MEMKANYVCGFCNKAFTRNASLKRHKTNVHMRPSYHCITCKKQYKRHEDLVTHSKQCLSKLLEDDDSDTVPSTRTPRDTNTPNTLVLGVRKTGKRPVSAVPTPPNAQFTSVTRDDTPSTSKTTPPHTSDLPQDTHIMSCHPTPVSHTDTVSQDLALSSDSECSMDSDPHIKIMAEHIEKMICTKTTRSIEVNTDQSRIHTADKGTQTEPLIILTPDELVSFSDGITIASFTNNIRIFVDTVNSTIVMSRPNLSTPPEPETQIGLLKIQPSASKGIQTKPSVSTKNDKLEDMCARKPTRPSLVIPKCKRDTLIVPESFKSNPQEKTSTVDRC